MPKLGNALRAFNYQVKDLGPVDEPHKAATKEYVDPRHGTTAQRIFWGGALGVDDTGRLFYDTDEEALYVWVNDRWTVPTVTVGHQIRDYTGAPAEVLPQDYRRGDRWTDDAALFRICIADPITHTLADWASVGSATARVVFNYIQATPSAVWTIAHGQDCHPSVSVFDSADRLLICDVEYQDRNTVVVRSKRPTAGRAVLICGIETDL